MPRPGGNVKSGFSLFHARVQTSRGAIPVTSSASDVAASRARAIRSCSVFAGSDRRGYPLAPRHRYRQEYTIDPYLYPTASGLTRTEFERMIRESGREPFERDANYRRVVPDSGESPAPSVREPASSVPA